MTAKNTELALQFIELCDGTRSRRTVAKEIGHSYDFVRSYATRNPKLNLKFLPVLGKDGEPVKSSLSDSEGKTNNLLMQRW